MLGLPGMSCGLTLANVSVQSVVPDVVDVLQQKNCKGGLHKKCNCGYWPKAQEDATKQHQLQHRTTGDRVRQRPMPPLGLQLPGIEELPRNRAGDKPPNRLALASRGGIGDGRHMLMVGAVVLGREVEIHHRKQIQPGNPPRQ